LLIFHRKGIQSTFLYSETHRSNHQKRL
jgi:hypothetical protein